MFSEKTVAAALSPKIFNLILLPTEKCNFRCTYCYEDFSVGRMSATTVSAIKQLIARRIPNVSAFSISWFGGEPLLAQEIVKDIGGFSHEMCAQHSVQFDAGFTTNGYLLTPELFTYLLGISHRSFQITLDGDEEWHDRTRIQPNRAATFSRIWSNLLSYKEVKEHFNITLRLHVHAENIESQKRLFHRLQSELLDDSRFSIYFHKISNLSQDRIIGEKILGRDEYLRAIDHIRGSSPPKDEAISEEHLSGYICYAAKPNSLLIRANGDIGKCTVALYDDRNKVGRINNDGTLDLSNNKLQRWFEGFSDLSEQKLGCPLSVMSHP